MSAGASDVHLVSVWPRCCAFTDALSREDQALSSNEIVALLGEVATREQMQEFSTISMWTFRTRIPGWVDSGQIGYSSKRKGVECHLPADSA